LTRWALLHRALLLVTAQGVRLDAAGTTTLAAAQLLPTAVVHASAPGAPPRLSDVLLAVEESL
jgi:hypothetical protein